MALVRWEKKFGHAMPQLQPYVPAYVARTRFLACLKYNLLKLQKNFGGFIFR